MVTYLTTLYASNIPNCDFMVGNVEDGNVVDFAEVKMTDSNFARTDLIYLVSITLNEENATFDAISAYKPYYKDHEGNLIPDDTISVAEGISLGSIDAVEASNRMISRYQTITKN